jgi:hypothetical protein
MKEKEFWRSKKWLVGVVGVLVPVANAIFGWDLSVPEVLQILAPLFAYIVGQGLADFGKNRAEGELPAEKPFWQSKKFWTSVVGAGIPFITKIVGIELDPQVIYGIVGAASAYITGQGLADFGKNVATEATPG